MIEKIDIEKMFSDYVEQGWIRATKHPKFDLYIFNYTHQTQIKRFWDEYTLSSRGLITDLEGNIVARPFRKFFNYSEYRPEYDGPIPESNFKVMDKIDGSMGIGFFHNEMWFMATRGAFESDQAIKGIVLLREFLEEFNIQLNPDITYLFEIVYPGNQIVVDYKGEERLILLGMVDKLTGKEYNIFSENPGFDVPHLYDVYMNLDKLSEYVKSVKDFDNKEGYVVRYENGFRLKVKFPAYCQLHKILSTLTRKNVLEYLKEHTPVSEQVRDTPLPPASREFILNTEREFVEKHKEIFRVCYKWFRDRPASFSRKDTALYFQECDYPGILFLMLDQKDHMVKDKIWSLMLKRLDKDAKIVLQ